MSNAGGVDSTTPSRRHPPLAARVTFYSAVSYETIGVPFGVRVVHKNIDWESFVKGNHVAGRVCLRV